MKQITSYLCYSGTWSRIKRIDSCKMTQMIEIRTAGLNMMFLVFCESKSIRQFANWSRIRHVPLMLTPVAAMPFGAPWQTAERACDIGAKGLALAVPVPLEAFVGVTLCEVDETPQSGSISFNFQWENQLESRHCLTPTGWSNPVAGGSCYWNCSLSCSLFGPKPPVYFGRIAMTETCCASFLWKARQEEGTETADAEKKQFGWPRMIRR